MFVTEGISTYPYKYIWQSQADDEPEVGRDPIFHLGQGHHWQNIQCDRNKAQEQSNKLVWPP